MLTLGKGRQICDYNRLDGKLCTDIMNDKFEEYKGKIYHNLRTFIYETGVDGKDIYKDFYKTVEGCIWKYRTLDDLEAFKKELDDWYKLILEEYSECRINNKGFK